MAPCHDEDPRNIGVQMHALSINRIIRALAIAGVFALASCGGGDVASTQTIRVSDYSFDMPDVLVGSTVDLEIINDGSVAHELGLAQIKPGTTVEQINELIHSGSEIIPEFILGDPGGINFIGPGERLRYQRHLQAGSYVVFCPIPFADGSQHLDVGMIRLFTVSNTRVETLDVADATITLNDDSITLPVLIAGKRSYAITNAGTVPHEVYIVGVPTKINPDWDVIGEKGGAWIEGGQVGPPPVEVQFPGGHQTIPPGETVVLTLTLRPAYSYQFQDFSGDQPIIAESSTS